MKSLKSETSQKSKKSALRNELRARRRQLDESERQLMDTSINHFLTSFISEHRPAAIAAFWPFDGEPGLMPSLELSGLRGTQVALPVIRKSPAGQMLIFRQWSPGTRMKTNCYGIPEPDETPEIQLSDIDLILIPLVGWDEIGGRLGMGAGFYDRALQPFTQSDAPIRAGVAYQLQKVASVPDQPWDIRLHMVLSETGWFTCRN
jgi:5-formyltetrahydrofolate cyclo-ligase